MLSFLGSDALAEALAFAWPAAATLALFVFLIRLWSQFELQAAEERLRSEQSGEPPRKNNAASGA